MRVTVYLKTPLFAVGHVPEGASVLEGELLHHGNGALELQVSRYTDGRGKALPGTGRRLLLPLSKVDHVVMS